MKKILLILTIALCAASCDRVREEVVTTYSDGSPELVYLVKGKESAKRYVGERRFYSNGKKHSDLRYSDPLGGIAEGEFFYPDGHPFAQKGADGQWRFFANQDQNQVLALSYDSITVAILGEKNLPVEVHAMRADSTWVFRFYEDFLPQSQGLMVNNRRQGKWIFFHPNGRTQLEAMFIDGVENGAYNMYRETGIPLILGFYINGQRAGVWEFYDPQGELSGRNDYDAH